MGSVAEGSTYLQRHHPGPSGIGWGQIPADNRLADSLLRSYRGLIWLLVAAMTLPRWDAHRGLINASNPTP